MQTVTLLNQFDEDRWEVLSESGESFTIKINHINAAPQLSKDEKVLIAGNKAFSGNSKKQLIVVDGDNIRTFDEFEE
jgi:uncharacterized protein (DUF952 family)